MTNFAICSPKGIKMESRMVLFPKFFNKIFARYLEQDFIAYFFFWTLVAVFLSFMTLAVSLFQSVLWTKTLCFFVPLGSFFCVRFGVKGLLFSFVATLSLFVFHFGQHLSFSYLYLGHLTSVFLDFFIIFLISGELRSAVKKWQGATLVFEKELEETKLQLSHLQSKKKTEEERYQGEISLLKEEMHQTALQRAEESQKLKLAKKEAEIWLLEKEAVLEELGGAKKQVFALQNEAEDFQNAKGDGEKLLLLEKTTREMVLYYQNKVLLLQFQSSVGREDEDLTKIVAQLKGQIKQLRSQFAEKTETLRDTRKNLFHLETRFLASQKEKMEGDLDNSFTPLEKEALLLAEEQEQEIAYLEDLIEKIL